MKKESSARRAQVTPPRLKSNTGPDTTGVRSCSPQKRRVENPAIPKKGRREKRTRPQDGKSQAELRTQKHGGKIIRPPRQQIPALGQLPPLQAMAKKNPPEGVVQQQSPVHLMGRPKDNRKPTKIVFFDPASASVFTSNGIIRTGMTAAQQPQHQEQPPARLPPRYPQHSHAITTLKQHQESPTQATKAEQHMRPYDETATQAKAEQHMKPYHGTPTHATKAEQHMRPCQGTPTQAIKAEHHVESTKAIDHEINDAAEDDPASAEFAEDDGHECAVNVSANSTKRKPTQRTKEHESELHGQTTIVLVPAPWQAIYWSFGLLCCVLALPGMCMLWLPINHARAADKAHKRGNVLDGNACSIAARRSLKIVWIIHTVTIFIFLLCIGAFVVIAIK